tara:strand:- start:356 stop:724 length:369 start_codon:yes stop_codon:yes gene_type:complete
MFATSATGSLVLLPARMLIRRRAGAEPTRHFAARGATVRFAVATSIVAAVEAETAAIVWVITNEASRRRAVGSGDAPPTKKAETVFGRRLAKPRRDKLLTHRIPSDSWSAVTAPTSQSFARC